MTTTKVQAENAKIQAAMTARKANRAAAQRARRAKSQAEKIARSQAEEERTRPLQAARAARLAAGRKVVADGILGILAGTETAESVVATAAAVTRDPEVPAKPRRARRATPEKKIAKGRAKVAARVAKAGTVRSASRANPRVLADPVANARLIRMRAKWAAERTERRAAKVEEAFGEQSPEAVSARDDLAQAWAIERVRYAEYRSLLESGKGAATK